MNEQKVTWAPVYDSARRPVEKVSIDELENVGVPFNTYGVKNEDVLVFEANPEIAKQAPRNNGQNATYLVACKRNGVKSWFNPNTLLRTDADMNPLYPKWAGLGSAKAVVEALVKMTTFTVGKKTFKALATVFNRDGSFKEIPERDAAGNVILNDDNTPKMERVREEREYPVVPDPA